MDQVCRDLRLNIKNDHNSANSARANLLIEDTHLSWIEYIKHHDSYEGPNPTNSLGRETKALCSNVKRFKKIKCKLESSLPPSCLIQEDDDPYCLEAIWPEQSSMPNVVDDGNEASRYYDVKQQTSNNATTNNGPSYTANSDNQADETPKLPAFQTARQILGGPAPAKNNNSTITSNGHSKSNTEKDEKKSERASKYEYVLQDDRMRSVDTKLAERILDELLEDCANVTWESIAGLSDVKSRVKEMVVLPMLRPDLFKGIRAPGKGLLLFGPPGTGKTMIGKCIASQSNATFFNISSASLTSKWVGEGEKMVKAMFAIARVMAPTVIFMDEIDSLLLQRNESDHESSRRMKTEFLLQFDGCGTDDEEKLLIVGATNRPEGLDEAARRRFTKRLYVPLPDIEARIGITRHLVKEVKESLSEEDYTKIGEMTEGYSGSDMKRVCNEASMIALRDAVGRYGDILKVPADAIRPLELKDFENALKKTKTSVAASEITRYEKFNAEFGALDI